MFINLFTNERKLGSIQSYDKKRQTCLTFPSKGKSVPSLPILSSRRPNNLRVTNSFSKSSVFPSGCSQSSLFSMFVDSITDPVDLGIVTNCFMERIDADHFKVFEGRILSNPIRAQNSQCFGNSLSNSSLSNCLKVSNRLELIDTLIGRLSKDCSLWNLLLSTSSPYLDSVDQVSLLGSVSKSSCLLRSCWSRSPVDGIQLTQLPASNSKQECHNFRLLLPPNLLHILVGSHYQLVSKSI